MTLLKAEKKALIYICLYYAVTQGLILLVSGLWFDDWCLINISNQGLFQWSLEMGRPDVFPITVLVRDFPEMFYKAGVFISYYIVAGCFYLLVRKIFKMDMKNALMLCLIYLCIPVNDVRIIKTAMPYTLGLMFWFLAFSILVYKYTDLKIGFRILTLVLFFCSFILNSLLVFYGLVLLYIIVTERSFKRILLKADFFVLPFIFFFGKQILFPAKGVYSSYNQVNSTLLFQGIKDVFHVFLTVFREILSEFLTPVFMPEVILVIVALAGIMLRNGKCSAFISGLEKGENNIRFIAVEFLIGLLAVLAGLYPYVVTGGTVVITGFEGRDSILVPFGGAMFIDALLKLLCKKEGRIVVTAVFMIAGIMHFTEWYSNYQCMYYWDRGIQEYLKMNTDLKNAKTIYFIGEGTKGQEIGWSYGTSFYTFNAVFEEVFGDENRLVIRGSELEIVNNPDYISPLIDREWYNLTGFDENRNKVDAVILYSNTIEGVRGMTLRLSEITGRDIGDKLIEEASFKVIYPEDEEFASYVTF